MQQRSLYANKVCVPFNQTRISVKKILFSLEIELRIS